MTASRPWRQVDRKRPGRLTCRPEWPAWLERRERRGQGAVGLQVAAAVVRPRARADLGDALVVGRRAREVEVQHWPPVTVPVDVEPRVRWGVPRDRGVDRRAGPGWPSVLSPMSSVAPDRERVAARLEVERRRVAPVVAGLVQVDRRDAVAARDHVGAPRCRRRRGARRVVLLRSVM